MFKQPNTAALAFTLFGMRLVSVCLTNRNEIQLCSMVLIVQLSNLSIFVILLYILYILNSILFLYFLFLFFLNVFAGPTVSLAGSHSQLFGTLHTSFDQTCERPYSGITHPMPRKKAQSMFTSPWPGVITISQKWHRSFESVTTQQPCNQ